MTLAVRPARPDDFVSFARMFPELAVDDPLPTVERWTRDMMPTTLIVERDGSAAGYAFFQVLDGAGYVRHVVTAADARRVGVGSALMKAVSDHMRAHGAREWHLNVKPENAAARALYERFGMHAQYNARQMRFEWSTFASFPPPEPGVSSRAIAPADDSRVETIFGLPRGLLADARGRGRALLMLEENGDVVGVASFEPTFPGSFPFRVRRPPLARNLLDAIATKRDPAKTIMNVVVEDDEPLTDWLKGVGAVVRMEILHYTGLL